MSEPRPTAPATTCATWAAVLDTQSTVETVPLDGLWAFLSQAQSVTSAAAPLRHAVVAVPSHLLAAVLVHLPRVLGPSSPAQSWPQHLPDGFHRLYLPGWALTLCVGPVRTNVAQWQCHAQNAWVFTDGPAESQAPHTLAKALARHCTWDAALTVATPCDEGARKPWTDAGFLPPHGHDAAWRYRPRWPLIPRPSPPGTRTALVIGAGLAGAATCASLTRRGWRVTLLDRATGPAQGASGLPVGMLSEHATARETTLSRLSRSGMALHHRELARLVPQGKGWQATLVTNLRLGEEDEADGGRQKPGPPVPALTVRPAALVGSWLAEAEATGLLFAQWGNLVCGLHREPHTQVWQALGTHGEVLAEASQVVVASAFGSARLLEAAAPQSTADSLRPVKGQLSFARLSGPALSAHPLRDHGVYVPCFEDSTNPDGPRLWAMGSTYERGQNNATVTPEGHDRNAASLAKTLPDAHARFVAQRAAGELKGWAQVRCASLDRLPLVGAVPVWADMRPQNPLPRVPRTPGLWTLCALGSRGLTLSMLAAELLVAQLEGEPWPVERDLALALDPARFALKQIRKRPTKSPIGNPEGA